MKKLIMSLFVMVFGISLSGYAYGATETATLNVTANSVAACTATASPIDFGDYVGIGKEANGAVTVNCTNGTFYSISLDNGSNYGFRVANERHVCNASSPPDCIPYTLFEDAALLVNWDGVNATADGTDQSHTVYGRIWTSAPAPPVGLLSDAVTVSVFY
jgi:spore coat protein U-like protein